MSTKFKRILFDYDGTILIHKSEEQGAKIAKALGLNDEQTKVFSLQLADFFENQKYYYRNGNFDCSSHSRDCAVRIHLSR